MELWLLHPEQLEEKDTAAKHVVPAFPILRELSTKGMSTDGKGGQGGDMTTSAKCGAQGVLGTHLDTQRMGD